MPIKFSTHVISINGRNLVRLPLEASQQLPSRGQTMVAGTLNGHAFKLPVEPDGRLSHWFAIDDLAAKDLKLNEGTEVNVELEPVKDWTEPELTPDLQAALDAHPEVHELWQTITPMARWEWVRWTRSTNNPETRAHRVEVAISKLKAGKRRPCCWNRNLCTDMSVSKSGVLIGATGPADLLGR